MNQFFGNCLLDPGLLDFFFYSWPKNDPKPPGTWRAIREKEEGEYSGIELQFALAGFKEEDLKVFQQGRDLVIEGDNTNRAEVAEKWKSRFQKKISLQEKLDISAAEVSLFDGILSIKVPLLKALREKKFLLGSGG